MKGIKMFFDVETEESKAVINWLKKHPTRKKFVPERIAHEMKVDAKELHKFFSTNSIFVEKFAVTTPTCITIFDENIYDAEDVLPEEIVDIWGGRFKLEECKIVSVFFLKEENEK